MARKSTDPVDLWWNSIKKDDQIIVTVHQPDGKTIPMRRTVLVINKKEMATIGEGNGMKIEAHRPVWSKKTKEISEIVGDKLVVNTQNGYATKITYTKVA